MSQSLQMTNYHSLPGETWIQICRSLREFDAGATTAIHTSHSLVDLSTTCTYLRDIASSVLLEKISFGPSWNRAPGTSGTSEMVYRMQAFLNLEDDEAFAHVRELSVSRARFDGGPDGNGDLDDGDPLDDPITLSSLSATLCMLLSVLPELRRLDLVCVPLDTYVLQTIPHLHLRHLRLSRCDVSGIDNDTEWPTSTSLELTSLDITNCRGWKRRIASQWIEMLPLASLTRFHIGTDAFPLSKWPALPRLLELGVKHKARGEDFGDDLSHVLESSPELDTLILTNSLNANALYQLPPLRSLRKVRCDVENIAAVVGGRPVVDVTLDSSGRLRLNWEPVIEGLRRSSKPLQILQVGNIMPMLGWTPKELELVVDAFPELTHLQCSFKNAKDMPKLMPLLHRLPYLQNLTFGFYAGLTGILDLEWQERKMWELVCKTRSSTLNEVCFVKGTVWRRVGGPRLWSVKESGAKAQLVDLD